MSFDSNFWYTIASVESNNTRSVHWCSGSIVCNSDQLLTSVNASWQIVTHDGEPNVATKYTLKNRGLGPDSALTVNLGTYNGTAETQPAMALAEDGDATQQWDLVRTGQLSGQNTWYIRNIANGSNWNFAEHGEGVYMAAAAQMTGSLAMNQTWIITKIGDINNATWSASPIPTPTGNSTTAGGTTNNQTTSGRKVSSADIAGIVLGTVLGVALIIAIVMYIFRVRRRRMAVAAGAGAGAGAATTTTTPSPGGPYAATNAKWITRNDTLNSDSSQEEKFTGSSSVAYEMPSKQSERSFDRTELPNQALHNGNNVDRSNTITELDATNTTTAAATKTTSAPAKPASKPPRLPQINTMQQGIS